MIHIYETIKLLSDTTMLACRDNDIFVLKRIAPEDEPLYKKLSEIKNDNIASITELTVIDGAHYAVREYVSGETLKEYVEKNGCVDDGKVRDIIIGICSGLSAVHDLGIVHRDITPSNIMLTENGTVKIIDFGISRFTKENKSRDTQILGTQGYAAPEQYGFSQTDRRADIYALGVLINYMKTGCMPNERLTDGIYAGIVEKATRIDENQRYKDVDELVRAVEKRSSPLWRLPGMNGRTKARRAGAAIFYLFFALGAASVFTQKQPAASIFLDFTALCFLLLVPWLICNDFLGWTKKIKPVSKMSKRQITALKAVLSVASVLLSSHFME